QPAPPADEPVLPRRRPADVLIYCDQPGARVYDFIRALTHPYPGAFSSLDGSTWRIWQAALAPGCWRTGPDAARPGQLLGPVVSPLEPACGQLVACGDGTALLLLEVERDDGMVLHGRGLSEQDWAGRGFG